MWKVLRSNICSWLLKTFDFVNFRRFQRLETPFFCGKVCGKCGKKQLPNYKLMHFFNGKCIILGIFFPIFGFLHGNTIYSTITFPHHFKHPVEKWHFPGKIYICILQIFRPKILLYIITKGQHKNDKGRS